MPQDMFLKGEGLSTPDSQADSFNKYFQAIFSNYDKPSDSLDSEPDYEKKNSALESITVTDKEVVHIL